jgi:hypothetical protein
MGSWFAVCGMVWRGSARNCCVEACARIVDAINKRRDQTSLRAARAWTSCRLEICNQEAKTLHDPSLFAILGSLIDCDLIAFEVNATSRYMHKYLMSYFREPVFQLSHVNNSFKVHMPLGLYKITLQV